MWRLPTTRGEISRRPLSESHPRARDGRTIYVTPGRNLVQDTELFVRCKGDADHDVQAGSLYEGYLRGTSPTNWRPGAPARQPRFGSAVAPLTLLLNWTSHFQVTVAWPLFGIAARGRGSPVLAQAVGGTLAGAVMDTTGARVPGVAVTLTNVTNGRAQTVVSSEHGEYRAVALQPASYRIIASLDGFTPIERQVTLAVGTETRLDFTLTYPVSPATSSSRLLGSASSAQARPASPGRRELAAP